MNFLRKHKTTFAMATMFGVVWIVMSLIMPFFVDDSLPWWIGIVSAAFLIMFGILIGPPEERRRRRELRREAKREMRGGLR